MDGPRRDKIRWDISWLLLWGVASSVWCLTASGHLSATFDEPTYLERGLDHWRTGSYAGLMRLGTMPLPVDVETLPIYLWEKYRGVPIDVTADMEKILPVARAGALVFWWLLLTYGWLSARHIAGPWGGRLAVPLLACEPSLLAHAGLATTDIAITACLLALVYHFRVGRDASWLKRVLLPGLWFAAALLAKASALAFAPLCLLAVEATRGWNGVPTVSAFWGRLWAARRDVASIAGIGFIGLFLYVGSDWKTERSFVEWANGLPEGTGATMMRPIAENLRIFSNAGEGLVQQVKHNIRSHGGAYLMGEVTPRAFWYYFPVALAIKLSLTALLLPFVVLVVRPSALLNWAMAAGLTLLLFSLTCRVQIGIRLVLPLVALAIVGTAAAAANAIQRSRFSVPRWGLAVGVVVGIVWTGVAAATHWPHGLCYVNEFWGGSDRGYLLLSDSNYDWGQGLKELADWQKDHDAAALDVWYFGSDPLLKQLPMRDLPLHVLPIAGADDVLTRVRGHYLAVGTTLLYGRATTTQAHECSGAFLRQCKPVARTTTFLIYDFSAVTP